MAAGKMHFVAGVALLGLLLGNAGRHPAQHRWVARLTELAMGASGASGIIAGAFVVALVVRARALGLPVFTAERDPGVTTTEEVSFGDPHSPLLADLYRAKATEATRAAIVVVHGGAWWHGDKGENAYASQWLAAHGYVVLDIQYHLAPVADWRMPVADLRDAVDWLRTNAGDLGIDPARVALLGRSAGGHLALLAALLPDAIAPPLAAVIGIYAPADLAELYAAADDDVRGGLRALVDAQPDALAEASPLTYARPQAPPTLLIHGTWDAVVPVEHSRRLARALSTLGSRVQLVEVPFARHAFDAIPDGLPSRLVLEAIASFLGRS